MREPRVLGRVLVAVASIVAAALLAGPAMSAVGSTEEPQAPDPEPIEAAATSEPVVEPQASSSSSPAQNTSPASSPSQTSSQSPATQLQASLNTAGTEIEKQVHSALDKVEQLVNTPPGPMDECLIDIGGIGPINLCI